MNIRFIGDTHGRQDLAKVSPDALARLGIRPCDTPDSAATDVLIHTGDLGAPWARDNDETLQVWQRFPCPVVFNPGNHENFDWIQRQPVIERWGCQGHDLGGALFAPLPGQIATIGGLRLWFYPGAYSIDYMFRNLGISIFAEEMLTVAESKAAIARLRAEGPVDCVVSHDGPERFVTPTFGFPIKNPPERYYVKTETRRGERVHPGFALNEVYGQPELYKMWFFGHHHQDVRSGKLRCLFNDVVSLDTETGRVDDPLLET